jgi:hypothetical protein
MKKWHRINTRTRKAEIVTSAHVQSAIESQLKYSHEGAQRLMAAAVTGQLPIKMDGTRFEFREA